MITGEIKNRIDSIWDTYWVGGITNPMSVLEQMTYLFFMKMIDDAQIKKEAEANILGVKITNPTFKDSMWHNPETDNNGQFRTPRHIIRMMVELMQEGQIKVWFYDMQADGYSLDQKRTEVIIERVLKLEDEIAIAFDELKARLQ
ncbi:MAG: hypothetical protein J6I37_00400 [Prevotella sp.]|nr:hypothetical protein [Prevotella sp.]